MFAQQGLYVIDKKKYGKLNNKKHTVNIKKNCLDYGHNLRQINLFTQMNVADSVGSLSKWNITHFESWKVWEIKLQAKMHQILKSLIW